MNKIFNVSAACIIEPSNLYYFSGLTNADAAIVLTPQKKYYITDKRIIEEAKAVLYDFEVVDCANKGYIDTAISILADRASETIGYEDQTIKYNDYIKLSRLPLTLIGISAKVADLRAIKSTCEIEQIKKAQAITDRVFDYALSVVREGITEKELASMLYSKMYELGGTPAFDIIAAFGSRTSMPHSNPTDKALAKGDAILLDFGAKYGGYCSDMTRSFAFGAPDAQYKKIYNIVLGAQLAALDKIKANMTGKECHEVAKSLFAERGLDKYFTHSLGHSLGIDIHEEPRLSPKCDQAIPEGAVVSVEPGLYFPSEFGIRIEDIAIIEKNGTYNLTNSPKELIII